MGGFYGVRKCQSWSVGDKKSKYMIFVFSFFQPTTGVKTKIQTSVFQRLFLYFDFIHFSIKFLRSFL
jgi:hypothetical protein